MVEVDDQSKKLRHVFEGPPYSYFEGIQNFYSIFYDFNTNRAIQISSMTHSSVFMNIHLISFIIKYVLIFFESHENDQ